MQDVDDVKNLERVEIVRERIATVGICPNQDTRKTNTGDASTCTVVTGGC